MRARARAVGIVAAATATALALGTMPSVAATFPTVMTSVDELQVRFDDAERTRPAIVSWRTTGEVDSGPVTVVPEFTLGETRYVERSELGTGIPSDYPISLQMVWHTPFCGESSTAARWVHGSGFIGRGRAWVGVEPTRIDATGYHQSIAPDGSKLQWAEIGIGGTNRFPPRAASPGGHMEARLLGTTEHRLEWFDPSESCFTFGVRRVTQDISVSTASLEAVGGDVSFQGGEELPPISIPLVGDYLDGVRGYVVFYEGLSGVVGAPPGFEMDVDASVVSDENGTNPELQILPHARAPGTWHETRRTPLGTDWQLRFTVLSYTETVDVGSLDMGAVRLFPGQGALVATRGARGDRVQSFRADGFSELQIGQAGARLLDTPHDGGTPYPDLNSCGLDEPAQGFPVADPGPAGDPGDGLSIRTPGMGDPGLPHAVPPGWLGFTLPNEGVVRLEDVTVGGHRFGDLSLPYVTVDGALHALTREAMVEGPIVFERQYMSGGAGWGIAWDTLMMGAVFRVEDIDLPVYWILHGKVLADSRGVGACAYAGPLVDQVLNLAGREIGFVWIARANLAGRPETYAKAFTFGQGYQVVQQEKTFRPILGVVDSDNFLGLIDKQDPGIRFGIQRWDGSGSISLIRYHGTMPANPESEVDGEDIDGADLAYAMTENRTEQILSETAFLTYPCGPCASI